MVVIGGGNTAIDAATAAVPIGRRTGSPWPTAAPAPTCRPTTHECELAKGDGVAFEWLAAPLECLQTDGTLTGLRMQRLEMQGRGRDATLVPVAGSEFHASSATWSIKALGQQPLVELHGHHRRSRGRPRPGWWSTRTAVPPRCRASTRAVTASARAPRSSTRSRRARSPPAASRTSSTDAEKGEGAMKEETEPRRRVYLWASASPNPFWLASAPPTNCRRPGPARVRGGAGAVRCGRRSTSSPSSMSPRATARSTTTGARSWVSTTSS